MELRRACGAATHNGNAFPALLGALLGALLTAALFGASSSLQSEALPLWLLLCAWRGMRR